MTVAANNVGWSNYGSTEGPMFLGLQPYELPSQPSADDKLLAVTVAVESGHYDAVNMYDGGIVSLGLIQWIDAGQHSVDAMLGRVADDCGVDVVTVPLSPALVQANAEFKRNASGDWRFFVAGAEALTNEQLRQLFTRGCGAKGTWTDETKLYAKTWAACLANVWELDAAKASQVAYTVPKLRGFLLTGVSKALYDGSPDEGWAGAARALMVSFAVNSPAEAAKQFNAYVALAGTPTWTAGWVIGLMKQVVFSSGIGTWPVRYNAIAPITNRLYDVTLPESSRALSAGQQATTMTTLVQEEKDSNMATQDDNSTPIAAMPVVPGEAPVDRIKRIIRLYVGCSLSNRRGDLGKLVSRGVDEPEAVVTISTNCATSALGFMALAGVKHPLLNKPYVSGQAISWVRQVGTDLGALRKFDGKAMPKPGSLVRYNTAGTNNDHVEWVLGPIDASGNADHAGGGRANNAITEGTGPVLSSWGRPLVEWWDVDALGIPTLPVPAHSEPQEAPPEPAPVAPPTPAVAAPATTGGPLATAPAFVPAWRSLFNAIVWLVKLFTGKK